MPNSISEEFHIDKIDKEIITLLQKNANITHSDIAKSIGRSQPAVGSRIHRLQDKGIISSQVGINFKNISKIHLIKVEIATKKPKDIYLMAQHCPFIINCMRLSGENNMMIFLASPSLIKIDRVVDKHFRNKDHINAIKMDIITDFAKDFILPLDFRMDQLDPETKCSGNCPAYEI